MPAVRPFESRDTEACRQLWEDLTGWHRQIFASPEIGGDDPGRAFDDHLAKVGSENLWVAEDEGEVVGLAGLIPGVAVATHHRRRGDGIFDSADEGGDTSGFYFHYEYLKEGAVGFGGGEWNLVGMYEMKIADASQASAIGAEIDRRFANSEYETKTTTEKAFAQSFANQIGNVGAIVTGIVAVVFFTLLLVAGNTMAQAVRERTGELGVLKTLGFTDAGVLALVLAESLLIAIVGGLPGLLLARGVVQGINLGVGFIPDLYIQGGAMALGLGLIVALGFVTGAIPAWQAMRLSIVDALRRT